MANKNKTNYDTPNSTNSENPVPTISTNEVSIHAEPPRYMIAPRRNPNARLAGIQPMSSTAMDQMISTLGFDVVRRIPRGQGTVNTLSAGAGEATDIIIARIEPERASLLKQTLPPHLVMARDASLSYGQTVVPEQIPDGISFSQTANVTSARIKIQVLGQDNKPLSKATVELVGDAFPSKGITNENGEVELELYIIGNKPPRLLTVTLLDSYWNIFLPNPQINNDTVNIIRMSSFTESVPGFPQGFHFGWGQRMMGLDKLPKEINGAGVKIAIIDSGCDNSHTLLRHIQQGQDFSGSSNNINSWNQDTIGHGTHCAGIIAARSVDGNMMRGFAPEAEVHILRVFPGGSYSNLIEALDYCIDHQIDVVNMSLGGDSTINPVVEEALEFATLNGVACIVSAGNSGGTVTYPASSPQSFAVAAIGNLNELHPNTWESKNVDSRYVAPDGIFSPKFTCFGKEISVCAPGVEIISTVPGGTFGAMSGTSMAAPHVTGLAAILLAHHPLLKNQSRSPQRVAALFNLTRSLCVPYSFGNSRTGAGVPNLSKVIEELKSMIPVAPLPQAMPNVNAKLAASALEATAYSTGTAQIMPNSNTNLGALTALQNTASSTGAMHQNQSLGMQTNGIAPLSANSQHLQQSWSSNLNPVLNQNYGIPFQVIPHFYTFRR